MKFRGILHAHSDLSHDGSMSPGQLREAALERGLSFLCLTDHAEGHTLEELLALRARCEAASDGKFLLVPGLEYRCQDGIDLLGLGVTEPAPGIRPREVARFIRDRGGVAAWAHPFQRQIKAAEGLGPLLDAVEVWNGRMESQYSPSSERLAIYDILRAESPDLPAFGGLDLHVIQGFKRLFLEVDCPELTRECLFQAIRQGRFVTRGCWFGMSSRPRFGRAQRWVFQGVKSGLLLVRRVRRELGWEERSVS